MRRLAVSFVLAVVCAAVPQSSAAGGQRSSADGVRSKVVSSVAGDVAITTSKGRLRAARRIAPPSGAPDDFSYPLGFFALKIDRLNAGADATVTFDLPNAVRPDSVVKCLPGGCREFDAGISGDRFTIRLRDGGRGDADGAQNGVIVDPVAPATSPCGLAAGEHVIHEWDGVVPTAAAGASTAEDVELFELAGSCSYESLSVRIEWDTPAEDVDLEVVGPGETLRSDDVNPASGDPSEEVVFDLPVGGEYAAHAFGWLNVETPYQGIATAVVGGDDEPVVQPPLPPVVSDPSRPRVVVADLDSAINPYHSFYYAGSEIYPGGHPSAVTQEVLTALGVPPENVVQITRTGNLPADVAADAAFWSNVQTGELYHFRGTNIIATSFAPAGEFPLVPDISKSPHGVGTSGAVLKANPDAVLLFVEQASELGSAESHEFAFGHPAVDMVTTSYGISLSAPVVGGTGFPAPETRVFEHTYDGVVTNGKLHFSSGGNGPGLTPARGGAGPWWSIGVSGIEEGSSEGDSALSGNFPDFVSDFTQDLPYCMDCESGYQHVAGTSFSTPRAAGVASKVLLETRRALGHAGGITDVGGTPTMATGANATVTNWKLRRALEQAASIPDSLAYDPIAGIVDLVGLPINPVAPWLQTAWGDLTGDPAKGVVPAALSELGLGTTPRDKPAGYCEFQTAVIEERKFYWNEVAPNLPEFFGGEVPPGAPETDPFVYC